MFGRLLLGVLLGVTGTATAVAGPAAAREPQLHARQPQPQQSTLTLVTGDIVNLTQAAPGRYAATVTPAAGRERISFHTFETDGGLRVVPADAVPLIESGRVDADLFNVQRLVADGYGDADSASLPLIVQGAASGLRTTGEVLSSIGATAVKPGKTSLAGFWQQQTAAIRQQQAAAERTAQQPAKHQRQPQEGTRIFLDAKVKPALDRSTAQIGAPTAWQRGFTGKGVKVAVLDTGVDAAHPDLAGRISGTANFSSSPDAVDRFGHGTHVASTVAGSGAASGGSRKGVAYGADLLIGKVLGDDGTGYESEIIAGMQWAAEQGAKVVNVSLGGEATDGLDPMSLAVDDLSESTGMLFVIAAGNEGADSTVGTPGAAADALTVGAVDRQDQLAPFSSRGPRVGNLGLKPEITAPGVDIVAARAAGTSMGEPLDAFYTAASGTSMATPHVAGAAAILAQEHPDWSGQRIKEALVSTARTTPGSDVYAQGAGRVDVARAVTQPVTGTPIADYGQHKTGDPSQAKTLTYTNDGAAPVTLNLQKPAAVQLSASTITVPANGSATVSATVAFGGLKPGKFSGWITAAAPGITVTTAVGAVVTGPTHKVTVKAVDRSGRPTGVPVLNLRGDDSRFDTLSWLGSEGNTYELQEGAYFLDALVEDNTPDREQATFVTIPELKVDHDITVLVDARRGNPIRIVTPRPAEQQNVISYYVHRVTGTGRSISHGVMHFSTIKQVNVTPTKKVAEGSFEFSSRWQLVAPMVQLKVPGVGAALTSYLMNLSPVFAGTRRYPLVKWGAGDVRGKAVLIAPTDADESAQIAAAGKAGAAVALLVRPAGWSAWTVWNPQAGAADRYPVVGLTVAHDDGERLLSKAPSMLDLTLTTSSPFLYDVQQVSSGRIPDRIVHHVTAGNSQRITSRYAHNGGLDWVREQRFTWRPWQTFAWNDTSRPVKTPSAREEWVSAGDSLWQHEVAHVYPSNTMGQLQDGFFGPVTSYRPGRSAETWVGPVVRPSNRGSYRAGDVLHLQVPEFVDGDGHYQTAVGGDRVSAALWRDGKLIGEFPSGEQNVTTTPGMASYRFKVSTARSNEDWIYGTHTDTEWTFTSNGEGKLPLLGVDYDVRPYGLNLSFTAKLKSRRAEISTDDGRSWKPAVLAGSTVLVPPGRTPVSIRVTAQDTAGNTLQQTVIRAYGRG
ncbi:S8 family serine peptidase [Actinoplanes sp. TFC3]|uniref:S8 family peptidase n=1 Tax=Actinoplanes sp. TFC3 TaxID=1710355 RepID=UPI00082DFA6D|nr:S8 family serine peptidase [Actinoplanes sp. TFC3]